MRRAEEDHRPFVFTKMRGYILLPFKQLAMSRAFYEDTRKSLLEDLRDTNEGDNTAAVNRIYQRVNREFRRAILAGNGAAAFREITDDDIAKVKSGDKDHSQRVQERLYSAIVNTTARPTQQGGMKPSTVSNKFGRCVKSVRKTVKARKNSNKESAAIAICVKSVLHPRGRTIKRYRKGRLTTQRRK
jgi:hypothetical protein